MGILNENMSPVISPKEVSVTQFKETGINTVFSTIQISRLVSKTVTK